MLRIAHLANPIVPISPQVLGSPNSISMIIYILTEGLLKKNVSVTIFGPTDSKIHTKIIGARSSRYYRKHHISFDHPEDPRLNQIYDEYLAWVAKQLDQFDLIQNHSAQFLNFAHLTKRPILTTVHGPAKPIPMKLRHIPNNHFVAISHRQQELAPAVPFAGVIHHGLNLRLFPFHPKPKNGVAWLGRITPLKGADVVLACARKLPNIPFHLAGNIASSDLHQAYTKKIFQEMKRLPNVTWHGPIRFRQKLSFLGNAQAVLMPVHWEEPFGLVAIEALACGTPVIAYKKGSLPEIIEHGRSGFLVHHMSEMVEAIQKVDQLDRRDCRRRVERFFSQDRMVNHYLQLYRRLLKST